MKLIKKYKFTLVTALLAVIFMIAVSMGAYTAFARTVTIDGSNFFYANGGASVRAHQETSGDDAEYYTMFHYVSDGENVTYRYNLAYHWYQAQEEDENGNVDYSEGVEGWFNLTIGFEGDDFDRYVIKFQSQQYAKTEDGVTTNYLVFVSDGAGSVYGYVTDDEEMTELSYSDVLTQTDEIGGTLFPVENDGSVNRITISYTGYEMGEYYVSIADEIGNEYSGAFKNIGGSYSKRVNSTTEGVMPLTFTAYFDEDAETTVCDMVLYTLNNQDFLLSDASEVTDTDGDGNEVTYYTGSSVVDDCPPVLCLTGSLTYLYYGEEIDFDYVVIDVLASSPKSTINYYVLSAEIYEDAVASGSASYFIDNTTDEETGESLFDKTSSDDYILIDSANAFLTESIIEANKSGENGYTVGCLVKVFLELTDVTSSTGNNASTIIYLDWYMDAGYLAEVSVGDETGTFIMAVTDEQGATYAAGEDLAALTEAYQAKVDELAYEDGSLALSAGSTSYFYLPSFEGFVSDNLDGYEDLTYTIYYTVDGSENSTSSLSYNNLSIPLSSAGVYRFTIYVTDSFSNNMYYIDEDGELVEFTTTEIYDDDVKEYLPWFTFTVVYNGVTIDDPGEQTTGYVDTTYSVSSFDINGVSSYYDTSYTLYRFDRTSFYNDTGISLSYSDYVENVQALFENTYLQDSNGNYVNTRVYFTTIKALADLNETDEDYDDFVDYEWDSSDLTFVPQDENSYYLVRLTVSDTYNHQAAVYGYMGIHVSAAADSYSGESEWLQNNLASVILFAIAGVALIGIIILFIIKPKEEGDLDEQLANEAEGIKAKKAKKEKKKKNKE